MTTVNAVSALLSDFASRVRNLEEKFNILRERVLVLTQNFVKRERKLQKDMGLIQEDNKDLRLELKEIKSRIGSLLSQHEGFVRKEEIAVIEKYFKLFDPIKFVTEDEIEERVERILSQRRKKK